MIQHVVILLKVLILNSTPLRTSDLTIAASCAPAASDSIMLLVFSGLRSIFAELCSTAELPFGICFIYVYDFSKEMK